MRALNLGPLSARTVLNLVGEERCCCFRRDGRSVVVFLELLSIGRDRGRCRTRTFALGSLSDDVSDDARLTDHRSSQTVDGVDFEGQRLRVEMSRASGGGYGDRYDDRGGYGGRGGGYGDRGPPMRGPPPRDLRRSENRVIISGLPPSCSWQDLKDFMRQAGDVIYTDVDRQGGGVVEFSNKSDQEYAVKKLDDTEFKDRISGDRVYVRVKYPRDQGPSSRSRSPRRDRSRSRDRSKSRSRSRSRSARRDDRDASPKKDDARRDD